MQLEDGSGLKDIEDQESRDPSIPIATTNEATPVYRSRETKLELSGLPVLADSGKCGLQKNRLIRIGGCLIYIEPQRSSSQYIGYLGPPPLKMIRQSPLFSTYFDKEGRSVFIYRL